MSNIENFKNINEVFESCYGAWISTLFGDAEYWNDSNTYNKQKESFFYLNIIPKIRQPHVIFISYIFGEYVLNITTKCQTHF
jgi:hypothetical protein